MAMRIRGSVHSSDPTKPLSYMGAFKSGDWGLLVVAGQFGSQGDATPAGWTGIYDTDKKGENWIRSTTVAVHKAQWGTEFKNINWGSKNAEYKGRQCAYLVVIDGSTIDNMELEAIHSTENAQLISDVPCFGIMTMHATAAEGLVTFPRTTTIVTNGDWGKKTDASWSSIAVNYATAPFTAPAGGTVAKSRTFVKVTEHVEQASEDPTMANGTRVEYFVWSGTDAISCVSMKAIPYGSRSVEEMLKTPKFFVAHRGGSASWPEHTERAYSQCPIFKFHGLEMSCGQSSDGVWFGCHDQSLSRLVPSLTKPADQYTWAEIKAAASQTEYMPARLDWLIEHYIDSHVLVVDPKYKTGKWEEFLAVFKGLENKIIFKAYGDTRWAFDQIRSKGVKTWGYAYAGDKDKAWYADWAEGETCDVLSMEYTAPQDIWTALKASGKPLVSHIPSVPESVKMGWDKGADGTICSNPKACMPTCA